MEFDLRRTSIFLLRTLMQLQFAGVNMKGQMKMSMQQQGKVGKVMHEFKAGKLKSSSGQKVAPLASVGFPLLRVGAVGNAATM